MGHRQRFGRYEVDDRIGVGGFAEVFLAHDPVLDAPVAIKVLLERWVLDEEVRERFVTEGRLLRRVANPHVVAVHDVGQDDDGRPYLVLQHADGGTLRNHLASSALVDADLERVVTGLGEGLGALHEAGIVHRDISPSNLLFADDRVIVGDLGLALDTTAERVAVTAGGGTQRFMAPEQTTIAEPIGAAADVYAATAVMWELMVGTQPPLPHELDPKLHSLPQRHRGFFARGLAVDPADRHGAMTSWVTEVRELLDRGAAGSTPWPADRNPYRGLSAFDADDADIFFGREALVDQLTARLERERVVLVGGASGVGKSSLLVAGVGAQIAGGTRLVVAGPGMGLALEDALAGEAELVIVDQLEQLFVEDVPDDERLRVLSVLEGVDPRQMLALVVRADFYPRCGDHRWLAELTTRHFFVGAMSATEVRAAIERPAMVAGGRVEADVFDAAFDELAAQPRALPLLAHTMAAAWDRSDNGIVTLADYNAVGGLAGGVAATADGVHDALEEVEQGRLRQLLLSMVTPGRGSDPDTRRPRGLDDLGPPEQALMRRLAEARLVTIDGEQAQLAHESLFSDWARLAAWIDDERSDLRARQELDVAAGEWQNSDEDPALLLRGSRLLLAERLEAEQLSSPATALLEASRAREARSARVRRLVVGGIAALAAVAVVGAVLASVNARRANDASDRAQEASASNLSRRLAADATSGQLPLDVSALLAVEAVAMSPQPEAIAALASLAEPLQGRRIVDLPVGSRGLDAVFASDGATVVTVGDAGELRSYDTRSGQLLSTVDHGGPVNDTAQAGGLVAVGGSGSRVSVWNAGDLTSTSWVADHGTAPSVNAVDLDAETGRLAVATGDGRAFVWRLEDSGEVRSLVEVTVDATPWAVALAGDLIIVGTAEGVTAVDIDTANAAWTLELGRATWDIAAAPDAGLVAVAGTGAAHVVTMDDGQIVHRLHDVCADCQIWDVEFSPDNTVIATGGDDDTARLWSVSSGEQLSTVVHTREVQGITFSPTGDAVLTASKDDTARLSTVSTATGLAIIEHGDWVWRGRFSPDGRVVATASSDDTVRLSQADPDPAAGLLDHGDAQPIHLAALGGGRMVTASDDAVVRVFEASGTTPAATIDLPDAPVAMAANSISGSIAVAFLDGTVRVLDSTLRMSTDVQLPAAVQSLGFGPEGQSVAALTVAGAIRIEGDAVTPLDHPDATSVVFEPDGTILTGGVDGTVRRHGAGGESPETVLRLDGPVRDIATLDSLVVAASATQLVSTNGGSHAIDELTDIDAVAHPVAGPIAVAGLLAGEVVVFSLVPESEGELWRGRQGGRVDAIDISPAGDLVAVIGDGQQGISVFDAASGTLVAQRSPRFNVPTGVVFADDGSHLFTVGTEGHAAAWPMTTDAWRGLACGRSGRNLTVAEWERYIDDVDPRAGTSCAAESGS